jgi:hypothetical protein
MKSSGDQSQQFNTTLILAIIVAALLACGIIGLVYGCMRSSNGRVAAPKAELQLHSASIMHA